MAFINISKWRGVGMLAVTAACLFPRVAGAREYQFEWAASPNHMVAYSPRGLALDSSGCLYIADSYGQHEIQKYSPEGVFMLKWGRPGSGTGEFDGPWAIAVDGIEAVYVADRNNDRIQKFSTEGVFLAQWGSEGSADGQFYRPEGVAVDPEGDVYVADRGNHRIQYLILGLLRKYQEVSCGNIHKLFGRSG